MSLAKQLAPAVFPDFSTEAAGDDFDADKIAALEARMQQFVSDGDTMGIATLLVKDSKVISYTEAGVRDLVAAEPITADTIYRIYSMTKPITGVALMQLWEQGKFSLEDPVNKFVPEFTNLKVVKSYDQNGNIELEPLKRQPTMRELMSHTAGFAYGLYGDDPANQQFMQKGVLASPDLQTMIDRVATIPLMFQPGERWFYSIAVDIQAAIVERISGQKFGDYLRENIFAPLAMHDTAFYVPTGKAERLSDVFGYHPETKKFQRLPFAEAKYNILGDMSYSKATRGMESGGGGLVATMGDYARFCEMLARGGTLDGQTILDPATIKLMRTNVLKDGQNVTISGTLTDAQAKMVGFGLDFGVLNNDGSTESPMGDGSYFWGGAAGTWFWIDPVHNLYFIGMIQRFPTGGPEVGFRDISRELVYEALND